MKRLALPLALTLVGCTVNAIAPISVNPRVPNQGSAAPRWSPPPTSGGIEPSSPSASGSPSSDAPTTSLPASKVSSSPSATTPHDWFKNLQFKKVRQLASQDSTFFIDFSTVFVSSKNGFFYTRDAGETWTDVPDVQPQSISCQHWLDGYTGYIGGHQGGLSRVELSGETMKLDVLDTGSSVGVESVYFTNRDHGWILQDGHIKETFDGGSSWREGPNEPEHFFLGYYDMVPDGTGTFILVQQYNGLEMPEPIYRFSDNSLVQIPLPDGTPATGLQHAPEGFFLTKRTSSSWNRSLDGTWYHTKDWKALSPVGPNLKTGTQILRGFLERIFPIDRDTLIGYKTKDHATRSDKYVFSSDGGTTWSDPVLVEGIWFETNQLGEGNRSNECWIRPFSKDRMWIRNTFGELLRSN